MCVKKEMWDAIFDVIEFYCFETAFCAARKPIWSEIIASAWNSSSYRSTLRGEEGRELWGHCCTRDISLSRSFHFCLTGLETWAEEKLGKGALLAERRCQGYLFLLTALHEQNRVWSLAASWELALMVAYCWKITILFWNYFCFKLISQNLTWLCSNLQPYLADCILLFKTGLLAFLKKVFFSPAACCRWSVSLHCKIWRYFLFLIYPGLETLIVPQGSASFSHAG